MSDDEDIGKVAHEETGVVARRLRPPLSRGRGGAAHRRHPSKMVNDSYGYNRLSGAEVRGRLAMGDDIRTPIASPRGIARRHNRRLLLEHAAAAVDALALRRPLGPARRGARGAGHRRRGALVAAAESRLRDAGCTAIQIEYEFDGDTHSQRLYNWYEGKLEFRAEGPPRAGGGVFGPQFRKCRKNRFARRAGVERRRDLRGGRRCVGKRRATAAAPSERKRKATCQIV